MAFITRAGRARPQGDRTQAIVWAVMRVPGLMLFVRALPHFLIVHVLYDPSEQTAEWIAEIRWSSLFWRVFDWSLLMTVLFHSFLGVRTVIGDYTSGRVRRTAVVGLSLIAATLFAIGTVGVLAPPAVP